MSFGNSAPLIYPDDFKDECKKIYPDWVALHSALDRNSYIVGRYLNDSCKKFSGEEINEILNKEGVDKLMSVIQTEINKGALYQRWLYLNTVED
jgi:hypothetical protein